MAARQQDQRLGEIAGKPIFRNIDGVSVLLVESGPGNADALLLSRWPEHAARVTAKWADGYKACAKSSSAFATT